MVCIYWLIPIGNMSKSLLNRLKVRVHIHQVELFLLKYIFDKVEKLHPHTCLKVRIPNRRSNYQTTPSIKRLDNLQNLRVTASLQVILPKKPEQALKDT